MPPEGCASISIGRAPHDVDAAAIGPPARHAGGEMLVGVGDAAVVFFLVFVLRRVGRGIAAQPELLDELVALFVVGELLKGRHFFRSDDVSDVLVQPLLVGARSTPASVPWRFPFSASAVNVPLQRIAESSAAASGRCARASLVRQAGLCGRLSNWLRGAEAV